ncbi:MAG: hypothetical protein Q7T54_05200 [Candidatus Levybacteria bacterium]|nr:hypothetical protein [Candidatus Levybacteria bacterium]
MFNLLDLLKGDEGKKKEISVSSSQKETRFTRYESNPIIIPSGKYPFMARAVYSPTAIYLDGKVHLLYRAQANDGVSTFGYATSLDGLTIDENLTEPVFIPTQPFEMSTKPGWNSGCEDPRITHLGGKLYLTYTAYDGTSPPRVAMSSINVSDFLNRRWNWETPRLISPPGVDDKDACIVKNKGDGYIAFHRLGNAMWIDFLRDLSFPQVKLLTGGIIAQAREDFWDNVKVGIAGPPIQTDQGWLLFYHAVSNPGFKYKIGAMLLDYSNPRTILARTNEPLLEPEMDYELYGQVPNVVFSCGAVVMDGTIYMYYGAADSVVCVATMKLSDLNDVFRALRS